MKSFLSGTKIIKARVFHQKSSFWQFWVSKLPKWPFFQDLHWKLRKCPKGPPRVELQGECFAPWRVRGAEDRVLCNASHQPQWSQWHKYLAEPDKQALTAPISWARRRRMTGWHSCKRVKKKSSVVALSVCRQRGDPSTPGLLATTQRSRRESRSLRSRVHRTVHVQVRVGKSRPGACKPRNKSARFLLSSRKCFIYSI